MKFKIVKEKLSDGSYVYNVVGWADGKEIIFGCSYEYIAEELYRLLTGYVRFITIE